jgi:site-specific recombinase XerD
MATPQQDIERFGASLTRRNYAPQTIASYTLDLQLFFAVTGRSAVTVTHRDVEQFVAQQHAQGLAPTTLNRRLCALKHFFEFLVEHKHVLGNPVKPSHFARLGRPLPRALSQAQVTALFAQITHPMDHALFGVMLRCGLRVSEVVKLTLQDIDWDQGALRIAQGKGRKDRYVYLSGDAATRLQACVAMRPAGIPANAVFWNRKRPRQPLSIKAVQKKRERYAKAAGIVATCHQLRHTFASNLLEHGAEIVTVKDLLGHESVHSSERYARVSNRKVKQEYMRTMKKVIRQTKV